MAATDSLPRFYKVFISHFSSDSMLIPVTYYDELPSPLPKTAIFQGTGGCLWNVAMTKKRDEVYFGQGWAKFVEDNHLRDGDILTFVYDGYRIFEVSIYGSGGCKETRAVAEVIDVKEDSVCILSSEDTNTSSEPEMMKTVFRSRNKGKEKVVEDSDEESEGEAFQSLDDTNGDSSYSPSNEDTITHVKPKLANSRKKGKLVKAGGSICSSTYSVRRKKESKIKNPEVYLDNPKNVYFETGVKRRKYELTVHAQLVEDYCLKFKDYIRYIDNHGELVAKTARWKDHRVYQKMDQYMPEEQFAERRWHLV